MKLPMLVTSGTHYEVGRNMGRAFHSIIKEYLSEAKILNKEILPFIETVKGQGIYAGYLEVVKERFPRYIEEMQGIADGAELPFKLVFTLHIQREMTAWLQTDISSECGCSDLFINYPDEGQVVLGHNEDMNAEMKGNGYIVQATIYGDGQERPTEDFTAYTLPAHLPGSCFGFNTAGLVFSCNDLSPKLVCSDKIPKFILYRAVLASRNLSQLEIALKSDGAGSAIGCSLNVVYLQERSPPAMWNYEMSPVAGEPTTLIDKISIGPKGKDGFDMTGYYFHCNKYEHISVEEVEQGILVRSSEHRVRRFRDMPVPRTKHDVFAVLGDEHDKKYPIYIGGTSSSIYATIATAIYDFVLGTVDIYDDNPKTSTPVLSLPLPTGAKEMQR